MEKDVVNIYIAFATDIYSILTSYIRISTHFLVENYKVGRKQGLAKKLVVRTSFVVATTIMLPRL